MNQPNPNNKSEIKSFIIESDIPQPTRYIRTKRKYDFPHLELEVGQSFILNKKESYTLRSTIVKFAKLNPEDKRYWTIRRLSDDEYRCWRVA